MKRGDRARSDVIVPGTLKELGVLRLINGPMSPPRGIYHAQRIMHSEFSKGAQVRPQSKAVTHEDATN
jgi:hypothetical protein